MVGLGFDFGRGASAFFVVAGVVVAGVPGDGAAFDAGCSGRSPHASDMSVTVSKAPLIALLIERPPSASETDQTGSRRHVAQGWPPDGAEQ